LLLLFCGPISEVTILAPRFAKHLSIQKERSLRFLVETTKNFLRERKCAFLADPGIRLQQELQCFQKIVVIHAVHCRAILDGINGFTIHKPIFV
ncbi:unnamed protein product, partial [Cylicocyclus nassatus]